MASSSSSSSCSSSYSPSSYRKWTFDVYPSFNGDDVRNTSLGKFLLELDRNLIMGFKENDMEPDHKHAIENSRIAVVVFSKNYASSRWFLNELVEIVNCKKEFGQLVIPIFYRLDPSHVREQTGDFGKNFEKTCQYTKKDEGSFDRWRRALTEVANIGGYHSESSEESKRIEIFVEGIRLATQKVSVVDPTENSSDTPTSSDKTCGTKQRLNGLKEKLAVNKIQSRMIIGCLLRLFFVLQQMVYMSPRFKDKTFRIKLTGFFLLLLLLQLLFAYKGTRSINVENVLNVLECIPAKRTEIRDKWIEEYHKAKLESSSSDAKGNADSLDSNVLEIDFVVKEVLRMLQDSVDPSENIDTRTSSSGKEKDNTFEVKQRLNGLKEKLDLNQITSQLGLIIGFVLLLFFVLLQFACKMSTRSIGEGGAMDKSVENVPKVVEYIPAEGTSGNPRDKYIECKVKPHKIQVFINFRGDQLRNNFVCYLVDALRRSEINVFIDNQEQRGEDLNILFKRIEDSGIAIVVFSSRYTESKWCLEELVKIKERVDQGLLKVLPIFYKVTPTNVKRLKGEFGDHFRDKEHEYKFDKPMIERWIEAIVFVSQKFALTFDEKSVLEIDFVKTIVKEVLEMLQAISKVESGQSSR